MTGDEQPGEAPRDGGEGSVFISYARANAEEVARIAHALEDAGLDLWWDKLIDGGAAFAAEIEHHLAHAEAVVVMWSARSVQSDWVRDEAGHARDRKRLVPVSLDGTMPPLGFRQYHVIDFSHWNGRSEAGEFVALLRAIEAARRQHGARTPAPQSLATGAGLPRRRAIALGGAAAALALGGGYFAWRQATRPDKSVAVLPFRNLSNDKAQDFFSLGLSEDLRTALTRLPGLKVAAPTSTRQLAEEGDDQKAISARLGVSHILEGSVRREGAMVRVALTLIDGAAGLTEWAQSFDRSLDDVLAVQREIASTVAAALALKFAQGEATRGTTASIAAYEDVLRGRALFDLDQGETTDLAALAQYDAAIAADPDYALAHAERSRVLSALGNSYTAVPKLRATYADAVAAARRAVELAPQLAAAQLALGIAILHADIDFAKADPAYRRATELAWGDADLLVPCATFAARSGRIEQAIAAMDHAAELDPLNARVFRAKAAVCLEGKRFDLLEAAGRQSLKLNPKLSLVHALMGTGLLLRGDLAAAHTAFEAEGSASFRLSGLAITEFRAGRAAAAEDTFARLIRDTGDRSLYQQAQVLAQFGRTGAALDTLDRAHAALDAGLAMIRNDAMFDPIRGEPRFRALLARMGIR